MHPVFSALLGVMFGTIVGFFAACLCHAAAKGDSHHEEDYC